MQLVKVSLILTFFLVGLLQTPLFAQINPKLTSVGPEGCHNVEDINISNDGTVLIIKCGSFSGSIAPFISIDSGATWSLVSNSTIPNISDSEFAISDSTVYVSSSETFGTTEVLSASLSGLTAGTEEFTSIFEWKFVSDLVAANELLYVLGVQDDDSAGYEIGVYNPSDNSLITKFAINDITNSGVNHTVISSTHIFVNVPPINAGVSKYYFATYDSTNQTTGTFTELGTSTGFQANDTVSGVAVNSTNGDIYASATSGVYKSTDGGTSFTAVAALSSFGGFSRGQAIGDFIALGSAVSNDEGVSFTDLDDTIESPYLLEDGPIPVFDPTNTSSLFISGRSELLKVENLFSAPSWSTASSGQLGQAIERFFLVPDATTVVGITEDGGAVGPSGGTWSAFSKPGDQNNSGGNFPTAVSGSSIYTAFEDGIYTATIPDTITATTSLTWTLLTAYPDSSSAVSSIGVIGDNLIVGYNSGTQGLDDGVVLYSAADGSLLSSELTGAQITAIEVISSSTAVVATEDPSTGLGEGLFRTDDGGASWESFNKASLSTSINVRTLYYDSTADVLYLGSEQVSSNSLDPDLFTLQSAGELPTADDFSSVGTSQFFDSEGDAFSELLSISVCDTARNIYVIASTNGGQDCLFRSVDGGKKFSRYYCVDDGDLEDLGCRSDILHIAKRGGWPSSETTATGDASGAGIFTLEADTDEVNPKCKFRKVKASSTSTKVKTKQQFIFSLKNGKKAVKKETVVLQISSDNEFSTVDKTVSKKTNKKGTTKFNVKKTSSAQFARVTSDYCTTTGKAVGKKKGRRRS
ncbi:MAG: hypothetical protein KDD70_08645 [Bdellovibrionales bacterium]|nr:hypothetical protein [Bdellovibrionales bacterium]